MGCLPDWMIERDIKIEPWSDGIHRPGVISYGCSAYGYDVRAGYKWRVFDVLGGASVIDPKYFDPKLLREIDLTPKAHHWHTKGIVVYQGTPITCLHCGVQGGSYMHGDERDYPVPAMIKEQCPKAKQPDGFVVIPPNSYALGESLETFTIPRDVVCVCVGKSTYARSGIIVNVTPGEPEWTGKWTIEISNSTPLPAKVYCGEGIMQCLFFRSDGYRARLWDAAANLLASLGLMASRNIMLKAKDLTCRVSYADKKGKYQDQEGLTNPIVEK
jgi:dCTP deaminase